MRNPLLAVVLVLLPLRVSAQTADWKALETEAVKTLQGYVRLNTSNPPGDVTKAAAYLSEILQREGIDEASIAPGDAIFFNYGTSKGWTDESKRVPGPPSGIGLEVARWIVEKQATMVGSDAGGTEAAPRDTTLAFPVHEELIMRNGIFNMENMRFEDLVADRVYEFLFVFTPLRLEGASGSPARPLAIR